MGEMTKREIKKFLTKGTFTGKLATVNKDGSSHVVPIWYVLEDNSGKDNVGKICFTTGTESVKAKNMARDNRVSISVDDQTPPFSFVVVNGIAKFYNDQKEILKWATKIARRYMGHKKAKIYGERNSGEGAVLVRVKPTKLLAEKNIAILSN
jgi:PPOX class probable F420-dependent enzyme